MRSITDAGWSRINATPVFQEAPSSSPQAFWAWARERDATVQRVAWFLLRMADAMEVPDQLESYQIVGSGFDPDRVWILEKETRSLMADFIQDPVRYIS